MEHSQKYLKLVNEVKLTINEIDINDVKMMIDEKVYFVLIDVREESEWSDSRIPNSIYIGKGILEREIDSIIPVENTKIVLYCGGGYRSALAAENLKRMGYTNVFSMIGGITEWEENNLPINSNKV